MNDAGHSTPPGYGLDKCNLYDIVYDVGKSSTDGRVITRLDEEEQAILRRARAATGKNTSGVIKAALRLYAKTLPAESPVELFERYGLIGVVSGPTDLSETYKQHLDYSDKHSKK